MNQHTPFHDPSAEAGAVFAEEAGWLIPASFGDPNAEYVHALQGAVLFDASHHGIVEVRGPDAASFLHNLCTNDIKNLADGTGCEAFLTNVQARVLAHVLIARVQDLFWLDVTPGLAEKVLKHLDCYLISEQVELIDRTAEFGQLHLAGTCAHALVQRVFAGAAGKLAEQRHVSLKTDVGNVGLLRRHDPLGLAGFDIYWPALEAASLWRKLIDAGAWPSGRETQERLRIEAGTPVYGIDMDESHLAPEVGRTARAISYSKGCFLGQEPLVRIRDLGHVNRTLLGIRIAGGQAAPAGTKLFRDGKEVGQITSSVVSPRLGAIGLAYIRRGHHEPGTALDLEIAGDMRTAAVSSLPFAGLDVKPA